MVENNRRLASHIDGTIKTANQEVNTLRLELNVTNEKLRELSIPKDTSMNCQCKGMDDISFHLHSVFTQNYLNSDSILSTFYHLLICIV